MQKIFRLSLLAAIVAFGLSGCIVLESVSPTSERSSSERSSSTGRSLGSVTVDNNETVMLESGTLEGTLRIDANNATVRGAGIGRTVIRGDVIIDGNANTVTGLTVDGRVSVSGNTNDLTGADLSRAEVSDRGNNNRY